VEYEYERGQWVAQAAALARSHKPFPTLEERKNKALRDLIYYTSQRAKLIKASEYVRRCLGYTPKNDPIVLAQYEAEVAWAQHELNEIERVEAEIAAAERAPVMALAQAAM
jgi:hypothetical protein